MTLHEEDFGCTASWTFFATSHGKGPYDGLGDGDNHGHDNYQVNTLVTLFTLGGCLKRAVARANLTTIVRGHIITPRQFFEYCSEHVQGITLMWCSEEEINLLAEQKLLARYAKAKTVPGTLGYHQFSVVRGTSKVEARIMSGDEKFFTHNTCKA